MILIVLNNKQKVLEMSLYEVNEEYFGKWHETPWFIRFGSSKIEMIHSHG